MYFEDSNPYVFHVDSRIISSFFDYFKENHISTTHILVKPTEEDGLASGFLKVHKIKVFVDLI